MIFLASPYYASGDNVTAQSHIEYSADEYMQIEGFTLYAKVFYTPEKVRKDQDLPGLPRITILRKDKGVVCVLIPEEKKYLETPLDESDKINAEFVRGFENNATVRSVLGEEMLNGMETTKSAITIKDWRGGEFEGLMWQSKNGIIVKLETVTKARGSSHRFMLELKNIRQHRQNPLLFEVPHGYSKIAYSGINDVIKNTLSKAQ